jgi:serine/threonine protein kinase
VINSVIGISKHAAYLVENSAVSRTKKIAAGGGGELFLAKVMDPDLRKKTNEIVVQKIVFVKNKLNEEAFFQEVGIMIMLASFPNFCKIVAYTESPASMILKYYPDGSLHDWIKKSRLKDHIKVKFLRETAGALNVMHSYYLAHCDLKPQNVLIEVENGRPSCYLTDFGITQVLSETIIASRMFNVINLRGLSVYYASPEAFINFREKKFVSVDFKKYDIYSFACVLYELISQKAPWA